MYNSPPTPTGIGSNSSSSTYSRVPATARPIVTRSSPRATNPAVVYVVSSDGPYRFHTASTRLSSYTCSTSRRPSASPARFTTRTVSGTPPLRTNSAIADGTVLTSVMPCALTSGNRNAFSTSTTAAPQLSGTNNSKIDRSKQIDVDASVTANSACVKVRFAQRRNSDVLRCAMATPFGRPVEPEV